MTGSFKAIRGMHDTLPDTTPSCQFLERTAAQVLSGYGYQEIRLPVLEKTELFERSIGETSDIVSKEMYTFTDRNGDLLTLRPEGTAGCIRAVIEHSLYQIPGQRLWYKGPMFRHERPQKGRLRQFHQIGAEAIGLEGPDIDAEMIIICERIWKALDLKNIVLEINSLGGSAAREKYHEILVKYFSDHKDQLDEDSATRLHKNPLRILDSKNPEMKDLIKKAPSMADSLDSESTDHFESLKQILDAVGISYQVNDRLVRGLDYYNRTVFEWITTELGAQGTVCGGGRYDGMVQHFGGPHTPAIGFSMGIERLVSLMESQGEAVSRDAQTDVYFVVASDKARKAAFSLAEGLRDACPGLHLVMHCGGGSFKSQFKKADKSGARIALVLGDDELEQKQIGIKHLRSDQEQQQVAWGELNAAVGNLLDC